MAYTPVTINKPQIVALAHCVQCGQPAGRVCIFTPSDDPHGHRARAMHSHLDRIQRARQNFELRLDASELVI